MKRGEEEDPEVVQTKKIWRKWERAERKKRERAEEGNCGQGMAVNEEGECGDGGGDGDYDDGGVEDGGGWGQELDPEMVRLGRKNEVDYMVKVLDMLEFGSLEEAWARGVSSRLRLDGWKVGRATNEGESSCAVV